MIKNGELLFDFKERIKSKYGYDEEFAQTLSMMAEDIAEYLGPEYENITYQAFESCKFVIAKGMKKGDKKRENVLDVLNKEGMNDPIEGGLVSEDDLKRAGGAYTSVPRISYDGSSYKIDKIDRLIVLPSHFNNENIGTLGVLAHEGMHLVKSFVNEYQIEGDTLIIKSGIITERHRLSQKDGKVKRTFIDEIGVGFEEGINSYDEMALMRTTRDPNYTANGYTNLMLTAGHLIDAIGIGEIIRHAQMTKDETELTKFIDDYTEVGYEEFLRILDQSVRLEYEKFAALFDEERMKIARQKLDDHFNEKIVPQVQNMNKALAKDVEHGYHKGA